MENLRHEIDNIDREMIELFIKRIETVEKISDYKKENGLPVLDEKREAEKTEKAKKAVDEKYRDDTEKFIKFLMDLSKQRQCKLRGKNK